VFLRNSTPRRNHEVLFTIGATLEKPDRILKIPNNSLTNLSKWSTIFLEDMQTIDFVPERQHSTRIGDIFNVKRGLATGANNFFIMTVKDVKDLEIPNEFLVPILPSSRFIKNIEIIEADISGIPLTKLLLFLLNCSMTKKNLKMYYPKLYQYILSGEKKGLHLRYLTKKRTPWYKQENRTPAPIVFSYMGRKKSNGNVMKFFRNKSKALATNSYFMLCPKDFILNNVENLDVFYDRVFQILKGLTPRNFILHGRSYGGGLYKIEPKELEEVVISDSVKLPDFLSGC
jgi:adenine-specific DNA-methyltransferase